MTILKWFCIIFCVFLFGGWNVQPNHSFPDYVLSFIGGMIMVYIAYKIADMEDKL